MAGGSYQTVSTVSLGELNPSVVTWTSATAINSVATILSQDFTANTLIVTLQQTTTITGGVVTFQYSTDGVNWTNVIGVIPGTQTLVGPNYTLVPNTYALFEFNVTGFSYFQVVLTTVISGSGGVTIGYSGDSFVGDTVNIAAPVTVLQGTSPWITSANQSSTGTTPTNVTISTSSATVVAANASRKGVNVCNIGFGTVSLAFGVAAVIFTGVTLGPGGTFWMDGSDFTTQSITAVATQSNSTIAVQEFQ